MSSDLAGGDHLSQEEWAKVDETLRMLGNTWLSLGTRMPTRILLGGQCRAAATLIPPRVQIEVDKGLSKPGQVRGASHIWTLNHIKVNRHLQPWPLWLKCAAIHVMIVAGLVALDFDEDAALHLWENTQRFEVRSEWCLQEVGHSQFASFACGAIVLGLVLPEMTVPELLSTEAIDRVQTIFNEKIRQATDDELYAGYEQAVAMIAAERAQHVKAA